MMPFNLCGKKILARGARARGERGKTDRLPGLGSDFLQRRRKVYIGETGRYYIDEILELGDYGNVIGGLKVT